MPKQRRRTNEDERQDAIMRRRIEDRDRRVLVADHGLAAVAPDFVDPLFGLDPVQVDRIASRLGRPALRMKGDEGNQQDTNLHITRGSTRP